MKSADVSVFDVLNVDLSGCNLIEASAGTGKTFSIGILVLRLLLEKGRSIDEILMVTFTEAAVEELRARVREFVRVAYDMASDPSLIDDSPIGNVVYGAVEINHEGSVKILKDALALIDEVAILTIHGFCNRTLGEFAFETQQLFDKEVVADPDDLIEFVVNDYWRNNITVLPKDEVAVLLANGLHKAVFKEVVFQVLDGKLFVDDVWEKDVWLEEYQKAVDAVNSVIVKFCSHYNSHSSSIEEHINAIKGKQAMKFFSPSYGNPEMLFDLLLEKSKKPPKYFYSLPDSWLDFVEEYNHNNELAANIVSLVINKIYKNGVEEVVENLHTLKDDKAILTFNDLISNLHKVLEDEQDLEEGEESKLITGLRDKYKAVFIDEFQDTDKVQIEIFNYAFRKDNEENVLFFIGDPKQSIYAFRKADLETYKKSREGSKQYTMATNYRSTQRYVDAMNEFFEADEHFFDDDEISYVNVSAAGSADKLGDIYKQAELTEPIQFIATAKKDEQIDAIKNTCLDLLTNHTIDNKNIVPSQIGILAFSRSMGADIKQKLNSVGVPAVVIDDTKVVETPEARYVQYVLEAIKSPNRSTINKALLTPLFDTSISDVKQTDILIEQLRFQEAAKAYSRNGIYSAIMKLFDIYNVKGVLLSRDRNSAQRILSNVYQLAELCQKKALRDQYDLEKTINWLEREQQNARDSKEGYELRLESDEEAVKIVTIHKSKGLAYDIVIAPSMQLSSAPHQNASTITYQDTVSNEYIFSLDVKNEEKEKMYAIQQEKENRRLMYVTLTRAKYKSIVILCNSTAGKKSYMNQLLPLLEERNSGLFAFNDYDDEKYPKYAPSDKVLDKATETVTQGTDFTNSWNLLSYSMISKKGEHFTPVNVETEREGYEEFVFDLMPKGAGLGNFLHYLFENADFQDETTFKKWIDRGEQLFGRRIVKEEMKEQYYHLIKHVLGTVLKDDHRSFALCELSVKQRLNELQFYFEIDSFGKEELSAFSKPVATDFENYKGFFQGFIDLVFVKDDKYYILDWKSNYLGNSVDAYAEEHLEQAMAASNYHLQYFIYTVALVRFLKKRIPDFDYEKHFGGVFYIYLRGCRAGENNGVFYYRPAIEEISLMVDNEFERAFRF